MGKGKSKTNVPALSEAAQAVFDPAINEYKKQQGIPSKPFSVRAAFGLSGAGPGSKFAQNKFNNLNNPNPAQPQLTMSEILKTAQQVAQAPSNPGFDPANPTWKPWMKDKPEYAYLNPGPSGGWTPKWGGEDVFPNSQMVSPSSAPAWSKLDGVGGAGPASEVVQQTDPAVSGLTLSDLVKFLQSAGVNQNTPEY